MLKKKTKKRTTIPNRLLYVLKGYDCAHPTKHLLVVKRVKLFAKSSFSLKEKNMFVTLVT